LSIGKDGAVVTLHAAVGNGFGNVGEHGQLLDVLLTYKVEVKLLGVNSSVQVYCAVVYLYTLRFAMATLQLSIVQGPYSDNDLYIISLIL